MITEDKITEIFFMADEFCKVFDQMLRRKGLVPHNPLRKRNYHRPGRLTHAEIITILIMFHCGGYRCLKHFYLGHICTNCRHLFPEVVSYNRFVELEKDGCSASCGFHQEMPAWEMYGHQLCRQHTSAGMPQPAHTQPPGVQRAGAEEMLPRVVLRLQAAPDMQRPRRDTQLHDNARER